jgi:hypothetical protein
MFEFKEEATPAEIMDVRNPSLSNWECNFGWAQWCWLDLDMRPHVGAQGSMLAPNIEDSICQVRDRRKAEQSWRQNCKCRFLFIKLKFNWLEIF